MKYYRFIDAVDKFWPEVAADHIHHCGFHGLIVLFARHLLDQVRAQVRRHDDNGIAEIHGSTLTVGEATVFQYL